MPIVIQICFRIIGDVSPTLWQTLTRFVAVRVSAQPGYSVVGLRLCVLASTLSSSLSVTRRLRPVIGLSQLRVCF
ncbi:MAG: hypothetical protein ACE5GO_08680, partial [Anaerolineales bacterium]